MNDDYKIVAVKSVMTGGSAWYLAHQLGFQKLASRLGVVTACVNVLSFATFHHLNRTSWITGTSLSANWQAIRKEVKHIALANLLWGLLAFGSGQVIDQQALRYLKWSFNNGTWQSLQALGKTCIMAPLTEEVFFRGFIQEKIEDVQFVLRTHQGTPDLGAEQRMRILLQAILFGLAHYNVRQGNWNGKIVLYTGMMGYALGLLKEKQGIHSCMLLHGASNLIVSLRVFISGG